MALSLDVQAQALLQVVQSRAGTIAADVEQQIESAQTQSGKPKLDADALSKVLLAAMPAQSQLIQTATQAAKCYHPDSTNAKFLTQLIDLRIEKTETNIWSAPENNPQYRPVRVDPLYAQFSMAPDAQFILLFNARDVDENGRPLLMKVVAREGADMTKLDLTKYRTQAQNQPDIVKVKDDADFIDVQDTHETEFAFGDPLKAVSLNAKADELSALVKVKPQNTLRQTWYNGMWSGSVIVPNTGSAPVRTNNQTGDVIDTRAVAMFDKRVELAMGLDVDAWQTPTIQPANLTGKLSVGRGLIFEPGASAQVSLLGSSVSTAVAADDAQLLGSPSGSAKVAISGGMSLNQILDSQLIIDTVANGNDRARITKTVRELVYADTKGANLGGKAVNPAGSRAVARADFATSGLSVKKEVLANDPKQDGQKVTIDVAAGLLSNNGTSVQGWKLAVGYMDPATNKWVELGAQTVDNDKASKAMSFSFDVDDSVTFNRTNAQIEVRAFTNTGFPAERLQVGYRDVPWASPPASTQGGQG